MNQEPADLEDISSVILHPLALMQNILLIRSFLSCKPSVFSHIISPQDGDACA